MIYWALSFPSSVLENKTLRYTEPPQGARGRYMSLFHWFTKKAPVKLATTVPPDSSGLAHVDATLPMRNLPDIRHKEMPGNAANRKTERLERREMLYAIVRECMTGAGVLSASYKFKVLSLDSRGRQYLVMMDLPREHASDTARLAEIEGLIARRAKGGHDILVTAVYWRVNDHVTSGLTLSPATAPASSPLPSQMSGSAMPSADTTVNKSAAFDPLQDDELAAFKRALASGTPVNAPANGEMISSGPRNPQPQFQDTEIDEMPLPLSSTQYGELK